MITTRQKSEFTQPLLRVQSPLLSYLTDGIEDTPLEMSVLALNHFFQSTAAINTTTSITGKGYMSSNT